MGEANEASDEWGEEGETEVFADEVCVMRKEGGVERVLDASDVETAVFGEGVVAVDAEGAEGEDAEECGPE